MTSLAETNQQGNVLLTYEYEYASRLGCLQVSVLNKVGAMRFLPGAKVYPQCGSIGGGGRPEGSFTCIGRSAAGAGSCHNRPSALLLCDCAQHGRQELHLDHDACSAMNVCRSMIFRVILLLQ